MATNKDSFTYGFFNSLNHDRRYNASQMSKIFDGIIEDGVYETIGDQFKITATNQANTVKIGTGRAWFDHTWSLNDAEILFDELPDPDLLRYRYDAIILDINSSDETRANDITVISGEVATISGTVYAASSASMSSYNPQINPPMPTLIKETNHHQYPLCYILRRPNTTIISQADIVYMVGTSACPFVTGPLSSMSIDQLVAQWAAEWIDFRARHEAGAEEWFAQQQADFSAWSTEQRNAFATWMAGEKTDFDTWFANLKYVLDGDVAGHLQNEIDELNSKTMGMKYGRVTVGQPSSSNLGVWATSEGYSTIASGSGAPHAEGEYTRATGADSHAEGMSTKATGVYSHAEGQDTTASGVTSHAEGLQTQATFEQSHAEGYQTTSSGEGSHSEGTHTVASGNASHAEGNYSVASGNYSHAEGAGTTASGASAHAGGSQTFAVGDDSYAEGNNTIVMGDRSSVHGQNSAVKGKNSNSFTNGFYSISDNNFSVGIGTDSDSVSNYIGSIIEENPDESLLTVNANGYTDAAPYHSAIFNYSTKIIEWEDPDIYYYNYTDTSTDDYKKCLDGGIFYLPWSNSMVSDRTMNIALRNNAVYMAIVILVGRNPSRGDLNAEAGILISGNYATTETNVFKILSIGSSAFISKCIARATGNSNLISPVSLIAPKTFSQFGSQIRGYVKIQLIRIS